WCEGGSEGRCAKSAREAFCLVGSRTWQPSHRRHRSRDASVPGECGVRSSVVSPATFDGSADDLRTDARWDARFPSPEVLKSLVVPAEDGLRLDQNEVRAPLVPDPCQ